MIGNLWKFVNMSVSGLQTVQAHSIRMLANWRLAFKTAMRNGLKMIINELKRAVLVRVVATAVVLQRHIHRVADRMELVMEMAMHQTWAHYRRPHQACSIQHQVSKSHLHIFTPNKKKTTTSTKGHFASFLCINYSIVHDYIRFHCIH